MSSAFLEHPGRALHSVLIVVAVAALASPTLASACPPNAPEPLSPAQALNPQAAVPALHYRSAFKTYRPMREQTPAAWPLVNEEVRRAGGWRAYASEAETASPPAQAQQQQHHHHKPDAEVKK
ncbi:hypothetical protein DBR47_07950 [Paucibacter sp. KBW04]|uniref:hypothetical protein n=1 Tax=Paucibacter sp. KBW04 TaxID=2153361 RepID=UPI000F585083|nr:hypothetical protein [Paucibacter sp. KBW04]RQO61161.1 hypothetical protein DBR47_07950 [Paucibacter sp. KBW04]